MIAPRRSWTLVAHHRSVAITASKQTLGSERAEEVILMTRTFRQSAATPNTAPITTINGFWQSKPPAGVHPHIIQVAVPIPAAEVSAVAPDPEALALWVICKKP